MDPKDHPHWDADTSNPLIWIDEERHLHLGDEELSWEFTPEQAERIGRDMIEYAKIYEELKESGELED